jgi:hypothetical protein
MMLLRYDEFNCTIVLLTNMIQIAFVFDESKDRLNNLEFSVPVKELSFHN